MVVVFKSTSIQKMGAKACRVSGRVLHALPEALGLIWCAYSGN